MKVTSLPGLPSLHSPWPKKDVLLASIRGTGRRSEFGSPPSHYILQARFCDSILWNKLRVFPLLRWCFYVKCTFLILSSLLLRWSFPQRWIANTNFSLVHTALNCLWAGFQTMTEEYIEKYTLIYILEKITQIETMSLGLGCSSWLKWSS